MKHFVIFNPGSKDGKSKKKINKIIDLLKNNKINFDYKVTKSLNDAYNYSKKANEKAYDLIIAAGGDGTINQVINGFYDQNGIRISKALFGVIYTGTSPDFCKSYNIPIKLNAAVETIKKRKYRSIKIGKITLAKSNKTIKYSDLFNTKYFACCTNIGLGATLAKNANSGIRKYIGDFFGTFFSLIKTINCYKANDFEVKIDGKRQILSNLCNLSIGKSYYIASGIKVKNELEKMNKNFYLLTVRSLNLFNLFNIIKKIYRGKKFKNKTFIELSYCNKIQIFDNTLNPEVEFDGDPAGYLPCKIEQAYDSLNLICNC